MAADAGGAFAHAPQSPVALAPAGTQHRWIDTPTIVADAKTQSRAVIVQIHFDDARRGMAMRVRQRFARDQRRLLSHDRMQETCVTVDRHREPDAAVLEQLVAGARDPLRQVGRRAAGIAQVDHAIAAFGDHIVGVFVRLFFLVVCWFFRWNT